MTTTRRLPEPATSAVQAPLYADVAPIVPLPASSVQTYTYRVPAGAVSVGIFTRVLIPFGRRQVAGVVTRLHHGKLAFPAKALTAQSSIQLTAHQIAFARWLARTMQGGFGYTLRLFYPPSLKLRRTSLPPAAKAARKPSRGNESAAVAPADAKWAEGAWKKIAAKPGALIQATVPSRLRRLAALSARAILDEPSGSASQVLILVPEMWLLDTYRQHFAPHFGARVGFVSSAMAGSEFVSLWHRVQSGGTSVVIGTQKALFLPFQKLGLVVVDEEFYPTHKLWDAYPRLANTVAARQISKLHGCPLIMAGSLPSLELHQELKTHTAVSLVNQALEAKTTVLSASFADRDHAYLVPDAAMRQIKRWVNEDQCIFILHNARGSWSVALCSSCKEAVRCPTCQVALKVHGVKGKERLVCHHCDYERALPATCPACRRQKKLLLFGVGNQRIADIFRAHVRGADVITIDAESADRAAEHLKGPAAKLLIGTTAAFRILAAHGVDRAVFLFPEQTLLFPDFRSEERAVYLVARLQQLLPPQRHVYLVTRQGRLVRERLAQPQRKLYEQQLRERKRLHYPPFADLVRLTVSGRSERQLAEKTAMVREHILSRLPKAAKLQGPYQAFMRRRKNRYELHLVLLGNLDDLVPAYENLPIDTADVAPARVL